MESVVQIVKQDVKEYAPSPLMSYNRFLDVISRAAWTCYRSEGSDNVEDKEKLVKGLIVKGHHSVLEHIVLSFDILTDRGVMAELTRHRLASYSIESTRYCSYGNHMMCVLPVDFYECFKLEKFPIELRTTDVAKIKERDERTGLWAEAMLQSYFLYVELLHLSRPEIARSVLPNSLATRIIVTANLREWLHIIQLRVSKYAHPQIRNLGAKIKFMLLEKYPVLVNFFKNIQKEA